MRLNKFVALATGISRRKADELIASGQIVVNNKLATVGQTIEETDKVTHNGTLLQQKVITTVMLNKPVGYVCSRDGQGGKTIYNSLPANYHNLKPVGRLDKDSSGLLLLTNDGELANKLTHPSFNKQKIYNVTLQKELTKNDKLLLEDGVILDDGISKLALKGWGKSWQVTIHEGRNRQIRRTFAALGYLVVSLHRIQFGNYHLQRLKSGQYHQI